MSIPIATYEEWFAKFPDANLSSTNRAEQQAACNLTAEQLHAYIGWKQGTEGNAFVKANPGTTQTVDPYYEVPANKPVFPTPSAPGVPKTRAELEAELAEIKKTYPNAKLTPFGIVKGKPGVVAPVTGIEARISELERKMGNVEEFIEAVKGML